MKKALLAILLVILLATAALAHGLVEEQGGTESGRSADGCPAIRPGPHPGAR